MTTVLPYHVGPNRRYSLEFVTPDREQFKEHLADRTTEEGSSFKAREITIRSEHGQEPLYAVYSNTVPNSILEAQTDREIQRILSEQFTDDQLQVLEAILDVFRGITETVEEETGRFTAYKDVDLVKIPEVLSYPDWGEAPATVVGGQLLSRFILAHPMPNANHRTGVGLLERYLRSYGDRLVVPDTGERGTWYEWARPYIHVSKRLITIRRNVHVFRYARRFGVDTIRRRNDVDIDLHRDDLHVQEPFEHFAAKHERRSIGFVETILDETNANAGNLESTEDPGWNAFVDALRRN